MEDVARHNDPATSHDAGAIASNLAVRLQREVYDAFKQYGEMTDHDLNILFESRNYAESTVRKRRSELSRQGLIVNTGRRDGRHAIWRLAEAA